MSQLPEPKLTYKHELVDGKHKVILYNSKGEELCSCTTKSFEESFAAVAIPLRSKIEDEIAKESDESLRQLFKPCAKRGDGRYSMDLSLWKNITEHDFVRNHIGIITQAELARIRGVSRQAINQATQRGDVEIFMWRDEKYIPFDTIAVDPMMYNTYGPPMVIFYSEGAKKKKPRRRFKSVK
jgi:hypothetical protein